MPDTRDVGDTFFDIWEPRIGAEATSALRRRGQLAIFRLVFGVVLVALIVALARSGLYWPVVLAFVVVGLPIYVIGTSRTNRRLADALAAHLGFPVTTKTLPPLRSAAVFDGWLSAMKAGVPPRERSFFGGFVKVTRPPK